MIALLINRFKFRYILKFFKRTKKNGKKKNPYVFSIRVPCKLNWSIIQNIKFLDCGPFFFFYILSTFNRVLYDKLGTKIFFVQIINILWEAYKILIPFVIIIKKKKKWKSQIFSDLFKSLKISNNYKIFPSNIKAL